MNTFALLFLAGLSVAATIAPTAGTIGSPCRTDSTNLCDTGLVPFKPLNPKTSAVCACVLEYVSVFSDDSCTFPVPKNTNRYVHCTPNMACIQGKCVNRDANFPLSKGKVGERCNGSLFSVKCQRGLTCLKDHNSFEYPAYCVRL